jgi:hypothetical protein
MAREGNIMKGFWATGLGLALSLGWLGTAAAGEEFSGRPPAASLGRPVVPTSAAAPRAAAAPFTDPNVSPAGFWSPSAVVSPSVVRAQCPEVLPDTMPPCEPQGLRQPGRLPGVPVSKAVAGTPALPPAGTPPGCGPQLSACTCCAAPACPDTVCSADATGGDGDRFYVRAEYLLWDIRDSRLPPIVTTSPPAAAGVLGAPGTVVLFGGGDVDNKLRSGGRFTAGYWFDPCQTCGLEGSFFFLGKRSVSFDASSDTTPVIARPFINVLQGQESVELTALPGVATGSLHVDLSSRLWGAEANVRHLLCCGCGYRFDLLAGFRYLQLDEDLQISEDLLTAPDFGMGTPGAERFANTRFQVFDRFQTRNQFYGGQLGATAELRRGRWSLDVTGKVALGSTHQVVNITGSEFLTFPGSATPQAFQGGLLALSSNIGSFSRDRFSVVPEVGVTVGYNVTEQLRVFAGYNFLYWTNVVRPGDQIDRTLDARRIPNFCVISPRECPPGTVNPARPLFQFHDTNFWAQGLTAGMEYRY